MRRFINLAAIVIFGQAFFSGSCLALGDPVSLFNRFFEDAFRLSFDTPSEINRRTGEFQNEPPLELDTRRSLQILDSRDIDGRPLACEDFEIQGYSEWLVGHERAEEVRRNFTGGPRPDGMHWPSFVAWNSPVFVRFDLHRTLWGNFRSAQGEVAVLGADFDAFEIIDRTSGSINRETLDLLFQIPSYRAFYDAQILESQIHLVGVTRCDQFSIFELEVR